MNGKRSEKWVAMIIVLLCCAFPRIALGDDQFVNAVGKAEIIGNNRDAARNKALANAFRGAVEKGIGVWIQSQTEVKDNTLAKDQILTKAEGYVTDHEILKEGTEDNTYSVTIRAQVSVDRIAADFKQLVGRVKTQMGNPSITFVLTTWEKRGRTGSHKREEKTGISAREKVSAKHDVGSDSSASDSNAASVRLKQDETTDEKISTRENESVDAQAKVASASRSSVSARERASGNARVSARESGSASGRASARGRADDEGFDVNGSISERAAYDGSASVSADQSYSGNSQQNSSESIKASGTQKTSYDGSAKTAKRQNYSGDINEKSSESHSSRDKGWVDASASVDSEVKTTDEGSYSQIDEDLWKKYPDMTIIDSFQQEFKEKKFDIMAADKAREIAVSESLAKTYVNPSDRKSVRESAEKEGANFVARGEVRLLDTAVAENTGNVEVTSQIGVEIIDVNSGDIVASYSNTSTASNKAPMEARAQAIKKIAVLAARTLAGQTIETWQERSLSGRQYTIEVRQIKSARGQQRPILNAIESVAQITSQTNPSKEVLLVKVLYKGDKKRLGDDLLDQLDGKPGFSETEFDGPFDEDGKIVFNFTK